MVRLLRLEGRQTVRPSGGGQAEDLLVTRPESRWGGCAGLRCLCPHPARPAVRRATKARLYALDFTQHQVGPAGADRSVPPLRPAGP